MNWERARDVWEMDHGRFQVDQVKDDEGMALYLAKSYVGKEYGSDKFRMSVSRNARGGRARKDEIPKIGYAYRMMLYKKECKGDDLSGMMSWRAFQKRLTSVLSQILFLLFQELWKTKMPTLAGSL